MAGNSNLHRAKEAKNDEFYTQLSDVENELVHYREHFRGKTVFCNCDDPTWSAFWKYFHLNFGFLGIKRLISTHYDKEQSTYMMEYLGGDDNDVSVGTKTPLKGNGDFRNEECLELLRQSDIVVTNPPFSLFREFIGTLMEYGKKFIVIGNKNAVTYKEMFPLLRSDEVWLGYYSPSEFGTPSGTTKKINGLSRWFTNLDIQKRHDNLILYKHYSPEEFPKYDNYDAINVDKVADIPLDYDGVMGVPITFLDKYNPEQFEIVAFRKGEDGKDLVFTREREREFNLTFVSLYDSDCGDDKKRRRKDKWEDYLRENHDKEKVEPIDLFYPNATNLSNTLVNDCRVMGKKTYVRMLIQRRTEL